MSPSGFLGRLIIRKHRPSHYFRRTRVKKPDLAMGPSPSGRGDTFGKSFRNSSAGIVVRISSFHAATSATVLNYYHAWPLWCKREEEESEREEKIVRTARVVNFVPKSVLRHRSNLNFNSVRWSARGDRLRNFEHAENAFRRLTMKKAKEREREREKEHKIKQNRAEKKNMAMKTEEQHNFRVGVRRLYRESIIRLNSTMMVSTTRKKEEERKKRERKREQNRGSGFLAKNGRIKSLAR